MTEQLLEIVAGVLETHAVRGRNLAVGLSGGLDSVALLDLLDLLRKDFSLELSAVHVNHQISAHAEQWEAFCKSLCAARGVALTVRRVRVPREGGGVEAAARRRRYQVYASLKTEFVALAHHLDDQAETLLLQLLRGAGAKGLAAMPVVRKQGSRIGDRKPDAPAILRPLLEVTRRDIEAHAKMRGLRWIEDDSNVDSRYDRNFLRNEILPRLAVRFPGYRETLARASRNLADYAELAEELAALDAQSQDESAIPLDRLRQLSDARARNLLRRLFASRGLPMPQRVRLEEALRQCREAGPDSEVHVSFDGHGLRCYRGRVELVEDLTRMPADWQTHWDGRRELLLPGGLGVLRGRPAIGEGIAVRHFASRDATVRGRSGGERMRPAENRPQRSLKNLFQETAVPPWERERMPLLFFGERLAWVPGVGAAAEFRAARGEAGVVPEWERRTRE